MTAMAITGDVSGCTNTMTNKAEKMGAFMVATIAPPIVAATAMAITRRNVMHAIVYLVMSFIGSSLLFYLLGAPFLAVLELVIYAGAIMVLFLFIVMMLRVEADRRARAFMDAVRRDEDWALVFPAEDGAAPGFETVRRQWSGRSEPVRCRVYKRVPAQTLWDRLMRATYEYAEPGVLFIDRINQTNNLWYREHICSSNPCGEIPLPPYGACDLGSINLTAFVQDPFGRNVRLDLDGVQQTAAIATRMMDNVIDASQFPLQRQAEQARGSRRIGLGLTGLADTLIMLGLHYAEEPARELAARFTAGFLDYGTAAGETLVVLYQGRKEASDRVKALAAGTGVAAGAPPASVEMTYCCANPAEAARSARAA